MATSKIEPLRSVGTRLDYVEYGKGEEAKRRRAASGKRTVGERCSVDGGKFSRYARSRRIKAGRRLEGYGLRISFSKEELDPADPSSIQRAIDLTAETIHELYPHCFYHIGVPPDGEGGLVHTHTEVINHNEMTGRAITKRTSHKHVSRVVDEVMRTNGYTVISDKAATWAEKRLALDPVKNAFDIRLGDVIERCRKNSATQEEFFAALTNAGVGYKIKQGKTNIGITYSMVDAADPKRKTPRRRSASKLCRAFMWECVTDEALAVQVVPTRVRTYRANNEAVTAVSSMKRTRRHEAVDKGAEEHQEQAQQPRITVNEAPTTSAMNPAWIEQEEVLEDLKALEVERRRFLMARMLLVETDEVYVELKEAVADGGAAASEGLRREADNANAKLPSEKRGSLLDVLAIVAETARNLIVRLLARLRQNMMHGESREDSAKYALEADVQSSRMEGIEMSSVGEIAIEAMIRAEIASMQRQLERQSM